MDFFLVFLVLFCHSEIELTNSNEAELHEFPHHVGIYKYYKWKPVVIHDPESESGFLEHSMITRDYFCAGTLVNSRTVITAAHCLAWNITKDYTSPNIDTFYLEVEFGTNELSIMKGGMGVDPGSEERWNSAKVSEIHVHEDFTFLCMYRGDIAILILDRDVLEDGEKVAYTKLPTLPDFSKEGKMALLPGWGIYHLNYGPFPMNGLRKIEIPVLPITPCNITDYGYYTVTRDCDGIYPITDESFICAGGDGKTSCVYDSGGGLVLKNEENEFTLIGVVHGGGGLRDYERFDCGHEFSMFTRIRNHLEWIEDHKYVSPQEKEIWKELISITIIVVVVILLFSSVLLLRGFEILKMKRRFQN